MFESMDQLEDSVRRRMYRMRDLVEDMSGVRASATSEDGAITVEVDGNGSLLDLSFAQSVSTMTPEKFEDALVSTATAAAAAAFARRAELVTAFNAEVTG